MIPSAPIAAAGRVLMPTVWVVLAHQALHGPEGAAAALELAEQVLAAADAYEPEGCPR